MHPADTLNMEKEYYADGRKQWRSICDNCGALINDTAPLEIHNRQALIDNKCPYCGEKITTAEPRTKK